MAKISDEMIKEINELAHKSKTVGLSEEEKQRQHELRQEYLRIFRSGFDQQLKSIKVVDANGRDVTPKKLKKAKKLN
ncbi:DUF896 domain-containing protein [Candidatus Stoquefichus sp. SB1]|uniref:DUF896 domain-containing protein n=1 Tax=Candidatus Stoquefichus sp. SB1 TaxID=1658109 RepID=UPI00067F58BB|nr:DUF896 domain-containing protein [Candidatus Stoquefichus sp. SB1]